jgi:hypothetical protein
MCVALCCCGCIAIASVELNGGAAFIGEPSVATGATTEPLPPVVALLERREFLAAFLAISLDHLDTSQFKIAGPLPFSLSANPNIVPYNCGFLMALWQKTVIKSVIYPGFWPYGTK